MSDIEITRDTVIWKGGVQLGTVWKTEHNDWAAEEFKNGCSWVFIDTEQDAINVVKQAWGI